MPDAPVYLLHVLWYYLVQYYNIMHSASSTLAFVSCTTCIKT